jgi:hypothetical protein
MWIIYNSDEIKIYIRFSERFKRADFRKNIMDIIYGREYIKNVRNIE